MFINKASNGQNHISGKNIYRYRKTKKLSQRQLADQMQLIGIDMDKNAIQRIEAGLRLVTDIELRAFAQFFQISADELLNQTPMQQV